MILDRKEIVDLFGDNYGTLNMACGFDGGAELMRSVLNLCALCVCVCVCSGGSGDTCWRAWRSKDITFTTDSE